MCSYLNLQIILIFNCFILDRNSMFHAGNTSNRFLDNPGVVVGVFLLESDKPNFVAVGVSISKEAVVTACVPLVKLFRGQKLEMYDTELYSVVAKMDMKQQERAVSSVHCFYTSRQQSVVGKSAVGRGDLGLLKIEKPFETQTTNFATVSNLNWDIGMGCKLYHYNKEKQEGPNFAFALQSFDVVPAEHRNSCIAFAQAESGIIPSSNQLCGFPLYPEYPPCDVVMPGSPVFCSGSLLIGLTENHTFSTLAGRCFFLVDAFTATSIKSRLNLPTDATSSHPQNWIVLSAYIDVFILFLSFHSLF